MSIDELQAEVEHLRDVLDRTDAVLAVTDEALATANEVAEAARRWWPILAVVGGVAVVGAAFVIARRRARDEA